MSRRSSRLLLDTSFLLPVLGFETSQRVMKALPKLAGHELYYSEISLLEALWKIVKVLKSRPAEDIERVIEGVRAIRDSMLHAPVTAEAVEQAIRMYLMGHRDMVDNLLYSIALANNLTLLTIDDTLVDFIHRHKLPEEHVITPEEL